MISAMPRIAIAVDDYDGLVATARDVLGLPVVDFSDRTVPDLGAHVGMCVPTPGSNIELMAPADPSKPLSQSLQKFLDRRGNGLYALMLEAADPDAEAVELSARGLDVLPLMAGAGGRDIHPRSTHGVLIRVYPDGSVKDQGPYGPVAPGLSGIVRAIIATSDVGAAAAVYGGALGLAADAETQDDDRGVRRVLCHPPKGGAIELVSVTDPSRPFAAEIQRFTKDANEGIFALVLEADDPPAAAALLTERGLPVELTGAGYEFSLFGARVLIE